MPKLTKQQQQKPAKQKKTLPDFQLFISLYQNYSGEPK